MRGGIRHNEWVTGINFNEWLELDWDNLMRSEIGQ